MSLSLYFLVFDMSIMIEYNMMNLNSVSVIYIMLFDWMSLMFMGFVLFISSMVIFYSEEYMSMDLSKNRFIILIFLFVLSMMLMIISPNLISILLGWDGLGLVSYCLVIYYQNIKSFSAGMLTALSNRIGDVMLLLSIAWMLNYGSWNFMFYLEMMKNDYFMKLISVLIMIAAFTKSAQIPFSSWLPAAMAAPTPVSSLVHSSTLVTAGVYLLIRFKEVFSSEILSCGLFISLLTMFMSGMGANYEFDLKKIIALSTLSQLGLMMSILFMGYEQLAFFHLLIHALFKALLFMCAGNMIHLMGNCQDIRYMGGLVNHLPLTCSYFNICNWSLCGLPFMSGFYSKDLIMEVLSMSILNIFVYLIFYISIGLTVSYSIRLSFYLMMKQFNNFTLHLLEENNLIMLKSMGGLIFWVIFSGSMFSWLIFNPILIILPFYMKFMTLFIILFGLCIGWEISKLKIKFSLASFFLGLMWNMPLISTLGVNFYPIVSGNMYLKQIDQGWFEFYGGQGLIYILQKSIFMQLFSKNHLKIFLFMLVIWFFLLLKF
uniref:NADH-ubiquinone oxidoreductase chain 5 n=1 Tax=Batophila aerata TaxID=877817 RepID=A0A3G1GRJ6_9CUCU|nr:NADH dehydrogenase subunit 5 [Batophila aerata]